MDEAAACIREFFLDVVKDSVHNMVADISACSVGEYRRITGIFDRLNHRFNRKIAEVSSIAVCEDHFIDRLVALVVRDSCVCYVDRNTLRSNTKTAACLANCDYDIRVDLDHFVVDLCNGFSNNCRDLYLDNFCACDLVLDNFNCFPCRVDGLAAERIKTSD